MELLFLLEAAEKSEKGGWKNIERELGWENLERELAWRENLGSKDNLRGEGVNMFNKAEWKDEKEDMDVWPQQPMLSNKVACLLVSNFILTNKDTTSAGYFQTLFFYKPGSNNQ